MTKKDTLDLYKEYFVDNSFERLALFQLLRERFDISSAIYPGSFVHITPSFVFPTVTYIEMDKRAVKFFANPDLEAFIAKRKEYSEKAQIKFYGQDYRKKIEGEDGKYDLLISQWAGIISKYCKRFLKVGGHLLVNNSHGDATMASRDADFRFVAAVINRSGKFRLKEDKLGDYFVPKKPVELTDEEIEKKQKGIAYTKTAWAYLFERVK